jgi:hypothetical protein
VHVLYKKFESDTRCRNYWYSTGQIVVVSTVSAHIKPRTRSTFYIAAQYCTRVPLNYDYSDSVRTVPTLVQVLVLVPTVD